MLLEVSINDFFQMGTDNRVIGALFKPPHTAHSTQTHAIDLKPNFVLSIAGFFLMMLAILFPSLKFHSSQLQAAPSFTYSQNVPKNPLDINISTFEYNMIIILDLA